MKRITVYKIRNKATGLYSTGGTRPEWTKVGKTWVNKQALKTHLKLFQDTATDEWFIRTYGLQDVTMTDWEIIPYTTLEGEAVDAIEFQ